MLHQVIPASIRNGRHHFHPPEFQARERRFSDYERSIRWEKRYINRLLTG
jgi:hypothetical protein